MNLDRFEEMSAREEADIELCEAICNKCPFMECMYDDETENCPMIIHRHEEISW